MKSSLKKLKRFALHKNDLKEEKVRQPKAKLDDLVQASQDMKDMRNCYDSLLSAAAAAANGAYEFSEALQEMGSCLLEKTSSVDDDESGRVFLMLGKAQFELQKLVDSYRAHIIQTITNPSESLLKELQVVEEMKRQCDDKRDAYNVMLAAHREKGRSKNAKGETISLQQLQAAQEGYEEEATLFIFRLKSLKQGQSRSLLTQAARHHAAQSNFFRKGLISLEVVEPHVKVLAEQQHIDYHFNGLKDNDAEDNNDDDYVHVDSDDELSFDYGQNDHSQDIIPMSRNSVEDTIDKSQGDFLTFSRAPWAGSQSAPIFPDKKVDSSEKFKEMQSLSPRQFRAYVLPTPSDAKSSDFSGSSNPVSKDQAVHKSPWSTQLWHSSPVEPNKTANSIKEDQLQATARSPKAESVLKESNINSSPFKAPPPLADLAMLRYSPSITSATKKTRRQAFSDPLTESKPIPTVEHPPAISPRHGRNPMHQASASPKISPSSSPPPMSSPRIRELHELPRPPASATVSAKPLSLSDHSAPLVSRSQEHSILSKMPLVASQIATPLPMPPVAMARSLSIPSGGERTPTTLARKSLEVPHNPSRTSEVASLLTPISVSRT